MKNWHYAAEKKGQACLLYLRTAVTDVGFCVSACALAASAFSPLAFFPRGFATSPATPDETTLAPLPSRVETRRVLLVEPLRFAGPTALLSPPSSLRLLSQTESNEPECSSEAARP